jgi:hypothetical protein
MHVGATQSSQTLLHVAQHNLQQHWLKQVTMHGNLVCQHGETRQRSLWQSHCDCAIAVLYVQGVQRRGYSDDPPPCIGQHGSDFLRYYSTALCILYITCSCHIPAVRLLQHVRLLCHFTVSQQESNLNRTAHASTYGAVVCPCLPLFEG